MSMLRHSQGVILTLELGGRYKITYPDEYGYLVEYEYKYRKTALSRYVKLVADRKQLKFNLEVIKCQKHTF